MSRPVFGVMFGVSLGMSAVLACSSDSESDAASGSLSGNSSGSTAGSGSTDPSVLPPNYTVTDDGVIQCGDTPCQCANGIDDDGDGDIDGFDAECTGGLDDDEGSFATGIPGDNRDPKWQDCFFDGNSGAGDDKCRYHTDCLTGGLDEDDPSCAVSESCKTFCEARTPNGCDCFGCCEVTIGNGSSVSVFIGGACTLEAIDDPDTCTPCEVTENCGNTCGECELCLGKELEDLPESCLPEDPPPGDAAPPPVVQCEGGTACETSDDCAYQQYCSLGCCLAVLR